MKQRLDRLLVEQNLAPSRERAQAFIMAGKVRVDGQPAGKSGRMISRESHLEVLDMDQPYVSRGGVKLQSALEYFNIDPRGFDAMDIGSSTGGFTDCLIKSGAEKVFAVDVGYGQLAWELRQDPRVVLLERTNIRHLEFERLGQLVDLVVIDASFISLRLIFPKALDFLKCGASLLALVKPQFEAGADEVGKRGKVSDTAVHERVLQKLKNQAVELGLIFSGQTKSVIAGKKSGNEEYFLWLQKPEKAGLNGT